MILTRRREKRDNASWLAAFPHKSAYFYLLCINPSSPSVAVSSLFCQAFFPTLWEKEGWWFFSHVRQRVGRCSLKLETSSSFPPPCLRSGAAMRNWQIRSFLLDKRCSPGSQKKVSKRRVEQQGRDLLSGAKFLNNSSLPSPPSAP